VTASPSMKPQVSVVSVRCAALDFVAQSTI
jgi:hypothetical protein